MEARGFAQRDGEDRPVTVDDVEAEEERDSQARALDGRTLKLVHLRRATYVEGRAEPALGRQPQMLGAEAAFGFTVELLELAQLLLQGHLSQQVLDTR
jgi:hypothetical protein